MKIRNTDGRYAIVSDEYSKVLAAAARQIPGLRYENRALAGTRDAIRSAVDSLAIAGVRVDGAPPSPIRPTLGGDDPIFEALRDYQREGVYWLLKTGHGILADGMGLGKSCVSLHAALHEQRLCFQTGTPVPIVIVCPAYVAPNWIHNEIPKWVGNAAIFEGQGIKDPKIRGVSREAKSRWVPARDVLDSESIGGGLGGCFLVLGYEAARGVAPILARTPHVLICDEAHYLSSSTSLRTEAIRTMAQGSVAKFFLTGTPMTNRPATLYSLLDLLSPGAFGSFFQFGMRYCNGHQVEIPNVGTKWNFDGTSNTNELSRRLEFYMLRRTLEDVSLQLPAKTRQTVMVETTSRRAPKFSPDDARMRDRVALQRALEQAADDKLDSIVESAIDEAKQGSKIVIFTYRKALAEHIARSAQRAKVQADFITGDLKPDDRHAIVQRHAALPEGEGSILSATIDSSGTGINLSFAQVGIFAEMVWEPHKLLQAEARLHRHGQTRPVLIKYPIAIGTIDEAMVRVVINRLGDFEAVVGSTGEDLASDLEKQGTGDVIADLYACLGVTI